MPWDWIARLVFIGGFFFAVWAIIHTVREAWPRIIKTIEEALDE